MSSMQVLVLHNLGSLGKEVILAYLLYAQPSIGDLELYVLKYLPTVLNFDIFLLYMLECIWL